MRLQVKRTTSVLQAFSGCRLFVCGQGCKKGCGPGAGRWCSSIFSLGWPYCIQYSCSARCFLGLSLVCSEPVRAFRRWDLFAARALHASRAGLGQNDAKTPFSAPSASCFVDTENATLSEHKLLPAGAHDLGRPRPRLPDQCLQLLGAPRQVASWQHRESALRALAWAILHGVWALASSP